MRDAACHRPGKDGRLFIEEFPLSVFTHKPSLWSRFVWALAESLGFLPRAYLGALTDAALLEKAELLIRLGDQSKAQRVLDAAARRQIDDPRTLGQLANLELRNGNKDVARRAQLRAAQAYLQRGMVEEATHVLQQILAVARDCLEARLALGQIAEGRYGHEEAVAHYLEAVKVLTAQQQWEGVQELLERVRQLQRVKTVLESETQMMAPMLGPGRQVALLGPGSMVSAQDDVTPQESRIGIGDDDGNVTQLDMPTPLVRADPRPMLIADAATERGLSSIRDAEGDTVADMPSPLRLPKPPARGARAPSTVIVEPDLEFPDTTDPVDVGARPAPAPAPHVHAIPSTFVRAPSVAAPAAPSRERESREAQLAAPTDIVIRDRDALPPELMIKIDTAVDFMPGRLRGGDTNAIAPSVVIVPPSAVSTDATLALSRPRGASVAATETSPPVVSHERRAHSVWDRAIVQGPRESITLNVGPEPEPLQAGEPSILRRATTGISSVLDSFISSMGNSKDGGGTKS